MHYVQLIDQLILALEGTNNVPLKGKDKDVDRDLLSFFYDNGLDPPQIDLVGINTVSKIFNAPEVLGSNVVVTLSEEWEVPMTWKSIAKGLTGIYPKDKNPGPVKASVHPLINIKTAIN